MALKTRPCKQSDRDFIANTEGDRRRKDCKAIAAIMRGVTGARATMWGESIVGFGRYRYKYASGHEGEWPVTGFSPRKRDLTIYIMSGFSAHGDLLAGLGKYRNSNS